MIEKLMIDLSDNFCVEIEWEILFKDTPSRCLCLGKASIWLYLQDQRICIECKSLLQLLLPFCTAVITEWVTLKGQNLLFCFLWISIFSARGVRDPVCQQIEVGAGMGWSTTIICTKRLLICWAANLPLQLQKSLGLEEQRTIFQEFRQVTPYGCGSHIHVCVYKYEYT